jgi:hypothetical protein
MAILKVFGANANALDPKAGARVLEKYDAFLLVEADDANARQLARKFPVEDITDRLSPVTVRARLRTAAGAKRSAPADKLSAGPHHYVVQFIGPVKDGWLRKVRAAGAVLRVPYGEFGYVVRTKDSGLTKIKALPFVRSTNHLPFRERIANELTQSLASANQQGRRRGIEGNLVSSMARILGRRCGQREGWALRYSVKTKLRPRRCYSRTSRPPSGPNKSPVCRGFTACAS